jgi:NAD(P)-dependent dehydrogenase (short-subunit alcohol dehydrogenase family)
MAASLAVEWAKNGVRVNVLRYVVIAITYPTGILNAHSYAAQVTC